MNIIERVRLSGKSPPSLLCVESDTDFETAAIKVVDANGTSVVRSLAVVGVCCFVNSIHPLLTWNCL